MRETLGLYRDKLIFRDSWMRCFNSDFAHLQGRNLLELGAGSTKRQGVTTIDYNSSVKPDILHNLDCIPWPIPDSSFDAILMFSLIEHVSDPFGVIEECHRILRPNGKIYLLTPHFSSTASFADLTHKWHFSARSFDYFSANTPLQAVYGFYSTCRFTMRSRLVSLHGVFDYIPLLQWLANKFMNVWEDYLCFVIRGGGVYIVLEKA